MKKKIKKRKGEGQMRIMDFGMEKDFVFVGLKRNRVDIGMISF